MSEEKIIPTLPALVSTTAERFTLSEVSADKAYLSYKNLEVVAAAGAAPYIPFKSTSQGNGPGPELWKKLWHLYNFQKDEFLAHYYKRSNVESTFSMVKRKFGGSVRSKKFAAQVNEVLAKVLCHNLVVVVHSMRELGVDPTFWAGRRAPAALA